MGNTKDSYQSYSGTSIARQLLRNTKLGKLLSGPVKQAAQKIVDNGNKPLYEDGFTSW